MKKNDSVKRLIILALGLIGLCVLTAFLCARLVRLLLSSYCMENT